MEKGKARKESKLLSIILIPHSTGKVKVVKVSAFNAKLAALLALFITISSCTGLIISSFIKENKALKETNAQLYDLNARQNGLIQEKASEISLLQAQEKNIDNKVNEFVEKYRELIDNYISSRSDGNRANRSGDRSERDFTDDMVKLKAILESLDELGDTGDKNLIDLSETEAKLKAYLDSVPTQWPSSGRISSNFGGRRDPIIGRRKFHEGLDIAANYGQEIRAAASGTVTLSRRYNGYGLAVIINHGHGITTLYAHSSKLLVKEGQKVEKGDLIAKVGSSGRSTGPHLHFEIRIGGEPVDPLKYLDKK